MRFSDYSVDMVLAMTKYSGTFSVERKKDKARFILKTQKMTFPDCNKLLREEAKRIMELRHHNLISYHAIWWEGHSVVCLLSENVSCLTLEQLLERETVGFTEDRALMFLYQITLGVYFIHGMSLSHCNLKPSNILIYTTKRNRVKLSDYGTFPYMAYVEERIRLDSAIYQAPECLYGGVYNRKTDVWSMGIILYKMLVKTFPFAYKTHCEFIMHMKEHAMDTMLGSVSAVVVNLILWMVNTNPNYRPEAASIMQLDCVFPHRPMIFK